MINFPHQGWLGSRGTVISILWAGALCTGICQANEPLHNVEGEVDRLFSEADRQGAPGVAVVVTRGGEVVLQKEYGLANIEYDIPVTNETIFHIASVSKQFTGFAIALLVERGKLSLDDDIRTYLPEIPDFKQPITVRHLLHHTSGLRDQWELLGMAGVRLDDVITMDHILKIVSRQHSLNNVPGEEIVYSNTNYSLLARIVERVSGQPFDIFVRANIFEPLGMNRSHVHSNHQEILARRAYPYLYETEDRFKKGILSYANYGATSVFTNSDDMAKWLLNFSSRKLGSPVVWALGLTPGEVRISPTTGYGAGLVISEYRGVPKIYHGGFDAGFRAYLAYFPQQDTGFAILGNYPLDTSALIDGLANLFLADFLTDEPEALEEEGTSPAKEENPFSPTTDLWKYTGAFYSDELETRYVIVREDDQLIIRHWRNEDVVLTPETEDVFSGNKWWVGKAAFIRDDQGAVKGLKISTTSARNVMFQRVDNENSFKKGSDPIIGTLVTCLVE